VGLVELPSLGVGVVYTSAIEPLIERRPELFQVLEVEPQMIWTKTPGKPQPYRVDREALEHIRQLPGRKVVHSVGAPVGGTVRPEIAQLDRLAETIGYLRAPWASEHLSFNQTPEFSTGFFLPPRQTMLGVETAIASIRVLQSGVPVPIAVETGVNYLRPRADELSDAEFVRQVVEGADCGLLLDLHNVYCNSLNGRQPLGEYLTQLPLERVWEIHLAGGMEMDGFWLDAHSGAIPDPLYTAAEQLIPTLPNLKAIIFEIFPSFVPVVGLQIIAEQVERLHALWAQRGRGCSSAPAPIHPSPQPDDPGGPTPAAWERTLGSLVIGRAADNELGRSLRVEPGVHIVERLIHEFSASRIVRVLRLTSRLLMFTLGPQAFRTILADYWSKMPPELYANVEAEIFARYLETLDLQVPHLAKIVEFERSSAATLVDGKARIVRFDFEPLPLLRALADGRLPDEPGRPGNYEIEITSDNPGGAMGPDPDAGQLAARFH
jgi:uncharacterized protein (UPF0276 family)